MGIVPSIIDVWGYDKETLTCYDRTANFTVNHVFNSLNFLLHHAQLGSPGVRGNCRDIKNSCSKIEGKKF